MSAARATLTVTGPAYAGKSALIGKLVEASRAQSSEASELVRLNDVGPIDGDERHVEALAASAAHSDGVLFVVDQDLRAPEVAAIARLLATGKPLYVVLNKADQFTSSDRDAIMVSIRGKNAGRLCAWSRRGAPPERRCRSNARSKMRAALCGSNCAGRRAMSRLC